MPSGIAAHSPQLAGLNSGILPPHYLLVLVPSPRSILPALAEGLQGFLQGPVVLPFLCLISGDVPLQRMMFAGGGASCDLLFASPIPCSRGGAIVTSEG